MFRRTCSASHIRVERKTRARTNELAVENKSEIHETTVTIWLIKGQWQNQSENRA